MPFCLFTGQRRRGRKMAAITVWHKERCSLAVWLHIDRLIKGECESSLWQIDVAACTLNTSSYTHTLNEVISFEGDTQRSWHEWRDNCAAKWWAGRDNQVPFSFFNRDWTVVNYQTTSWTWPRHNGLLTSAGDWRGTGWCIAITTRRAFIAD